MITLNNNKPEIELSSEDLQVFVEVLNSYKLDDKTQENLNIVMNYYNFFNDCIPNKHHEVPRPTRLDDVVLEGRPTRMPRPTLQELADFEFGAPENEPVRERVAFNETLAQTPDIHFHAGTRVDQF